MITVHLNESLEQFVRSAVNTGRYATLDEVIADAVTRLRRQIAESTPEPDQSGSTSGPAKKLTKQEFRRHLVNIGLLDQSDETAAAAAPDLIDSEGEIVDEVMIRERLIEWLASFLEN